MGLLLRRRLRCHFPNQSRHERLNTGGNGAFTPANQMLQEALKEQDSLMGDNSNQGDTQDSGAEGDNTGNDSTTGSDSTDNASGENSSESQDSNPVVKHHASEDQTLQDRKSVV